MSSRELSALEQQILQEKARRVMNDPDLIVVEPDAPEEFHRETMPKAVR